MRQAQVIRRRLSEIPLRLIISRNGDSVTIVDEIGRSQTLKADGKKQDRLTGDGEFTSKARFEGAKLVVEEDFGGPKLITTFTPTARRRRTAASRSDDEGGEHARRRPGTSRAARRAP